MRAKMRTLTDKSKEVKRRKFEIEDHFDDCGDDMKGLGLVDDIVPEPLGGAHANREETFATVKSLLLKELDKLQKQDADKRINTRLRKFSNMGVVAG